MSRIGGIQRYLHIHSKERKLKGILDNLTPGNTEEISEQVIAVNIENLLALSFLASQIFEKALIEPTLCEMYANLCFHLEAELPYFIQDNKKISFKRLLVNMCQEQFERNERELEEENKVDEGERRRVLGNIRLIGELYKKKVLPEKIIHACIMKLLGEEVVEALCELMSITGEMIDRPRAKEHMDLYFERMSLLLNNVNLTSRLRFMLKDLIDLRNNKWQIWFDAQPDSIVSAVSAKKYSRDFLLKFAEQCNELPEGFEIDAEISETLMSVSVSSHVNEENQRQSKAVYNDRLGELFYRLEKLQCCVGDRFDHVDTNIASLDYQMRRLEYCHQDATRFRIILIMLLVLNMLGMLYFCPKVRN